MNSVVVLGSANADVVVGVERRPAAGETILGDDAQIFPGGKGANQAAAAARCGAPVRFLGAMGADSNAALLQESLRQAGVDTSHVATVERPTGMAFILLTPDAQNSIVVSPGANSAIDVAAADQVRSQWLAATVLVLNLEIPRATVEHAAREAAAAGVRVLLNAAPAQVLDPALLACCDPLVVNELEAQVVLNEGTIPADEPHQVAEKLLALGARSVIVTLGTEGAVVAESSGTVHVPAYRVATVDTTGAGDAFVGATAAELARGVPLAQAVRFATAMSALAVQRMGAQSSYAPRAEVDEFIARHSSA